MRSCCGRRRSGPRHPPHQPNVPAPSIGILAFDADKAGREACTAAEIVLRSRMVQTKRLFLPHEGQNDEGFGPKLDPGGLSYDAAKARVHYLLNS